MGKKNEVAIVPVSKYAVMNLDLEGGNIAEVMAENLGNETLTAQDFDKIKVPTGGQTVWMIPTLEGEEEPQKEIVGVIMHWQTVKALWLTPFEESGGNTPPDAYSEDGKHIIALNPELEWYDDNLEHMILSENCIYDQFGSGKNGKGKLMKEIRLLFVLLPDNALPVVIPAPVMSIKNIKKYFMRLGSKAVPYYGAITRLTLTKAKNGDGIEYSQIEANFVERLSPEETAKVKAYANQMRAAMASVRIEQMDLADAAEVEE